METINVTKLLEDNRDLGRTDESEWLEWAIVELAAQVENPSLYGKGPGGVQFNIECKINGHEVKLSRLIALMGRSYEQQLK
ncbi:MAG: hypothetical protein ACXABY_33335, partial [Candidatus Thorarchaeota archaeon]